MNKSLTALLLFFLLVLGMSFLFSRWWRDRTGKLSITQVSSTPTPKPKSSNLASLLSRMRPLADDEKTFELESRQDNLSGLVRYTEEQGQITFTVFLLPTESISQDLYLWVTTGDQTREFGLFEDGKGGLLLSGKLNSNLLPAEFKIASKVKNQIGEIFLSGIMK
jgi:hypothetical protein